MMLFERLKCEFEFVDDRGSLVQLAHNGYEQINVLYTKKGVLRGGHYHKDTKEVFYIISGAVQVELKNGTEYVDETFAKGDFFLIQPYTIHSMSFLEDTTMVAMYEHAVERKNGEKDIFPALTM